MMIGAVAVYLHSLRERCIMTTFDPDTLEKDGEVLRDIHRRFDGLLALNADGDTARRRAGRRSGPPAGPTNETDEIRRRALAPGREPTRRCSSAASMASS